MGGQFVLLLSLSLSCLQDRRGAARAAAAYEYYNE